jgi:hypothetical protein
MMKKYYLIRSYSGGVWFGLLKNLNGDVCVLINARNIWSWEGATCLAQIAKTGIKSGRVSSAITDEEGVYITQVCNILPMESAAVENLINQPEWTV